MLSGTKLFFVIVAFLLSNGTVDRSTVPYSAQQQTCQEVAFDTVHAYVSQNMQLKQGDDVKIKGLGVECVEVDVVPILNAGGSDAAP